MKAKSVMVLGTASGVGKSVIAAGLCRLISDWGFRVAPFKAQNMSNNSFVTADCGEIGRAQAVQAECARVEPTTDMNPILLKPSADNCSQVILHGKAIGNFPARAYYGKRALMEAAVRESYERLASQYEVLVIEGAGSPAEVNLKKFDLVNMRMAEMADAHCVLVSDIDRGGVFASLVGTLDLLEDHERQRIAGLLINKFRGDRALFDEGVQFLEQKTGKKVWGVLPFDRELRIEEEDAQGMSSSNALVGDDARIDIAIIRLPRISNFTDFDALAQAPGVRVRFVQSASQFGNPDLVILPGTKATIADYQDLIESGLGAAIREYAAAGGRIFGLCGGYQMMGKIISDPKAVESAQKEIEGFGFFPMKTEFHSEKIVRPAAGFADLNLFGSRVSGNWKGYEIHMGVSDSKEGVVRSSGQFAGTYIHGIFDEAEFRESFLNALAKAAGKTRIESSDKSFSALKEKQYTRLKKMLEANMNLDFLREILGVRVPAGI